MAENKEKTAEKKAETTKKTTEEFVVVNVNGSQEKVSVGDTVIVNKLEGEAGSKLKFNEVLLSHKSGKTLVGKPYLDKEVVEMEIVEQTRDKKIHIRTFKSKSRHRKHIGHRQYITVLKVTKI